MRADHGASALAISKVDGEIAGVGERYGRPRGGEVVAGRQASEKRRQRECEKRRQREGGDDLLVRPPSFPCTFS
jgi:hypothetical protein